MTQRGDAGFKYTDPDSSKEVTVRLNGEMRDISAQEARTRFTRWSIDSTARDVVAVGSRARQVSGMVRYQGRVTEFAKMLDHGLNGVTLNYYQSLQYTANPIPCQLVSVNGSADVQYGPDPSTWFRGEHSTELLLRRTDGDSFDELLNFVVLRYYPGLDNIALTRADATTCATQVSNAGIIETVAANVLRDEHYIDGERHTLLEPARTNGWTHSEAISDGATWSRIGLSGATANAVTAPDGTVTGDKIVEDTSTGLHLVSRSLAGTTDNANQAVSIFARAAERGYAFVRTVTKGNVAALSYVNLSTATAGTTAASHTLSVTDLGNNWVRVTCVFNVGSGATTPAAQFGIASADGTSSYTGDGASGIFLWGGMFEANAPFPTSYIKTEASTVTRAADAAYIDLPAPIADPSALAVYFRWTQAYAGAGGASSPVLWQIGSATESQDPRFLMYAPTGTTNLRARHDTGSSSVESIALSTGSEAGAVHEVAAVLDDEGRATLHTSVDEATPVSGSQTAALALADAWAGTRLTLNMGARGAIAIRDVKVAYKGGREPYEGSATAIMQSLRDA